MRFPTGDSCAIHLGVVDVVVDQNVEGFQPRVLRNGLAATPAVSTMVVGDLMAGVGHARCGLDGLDGQLERALRTTIGCVLVYARVRGLACANTP